MLTTSIATAIGAMFCWGFGDFFIQKGTRKLGNIETLAWIGLLGSIGLIPFVLKDFALLLDKSNLITLFALGIVTFVVAIANFEALRRGKLSVVEALLEFELPITAILGFFFLQESISFVQALLIATVFIGVVLIATKSGDFKKRHFLEHGAILAIVTAVGYGLVNFLTAVGAKEISPLLVIWLPWITFSLICISYLAIKGRIRSFYNHARSYKSLILAIGIIDTLAWVLFAIALEKKELAVTIAITESYPAISLILGIKLNKENISSRQILGVILTIAASFFIGALG